MPKRVPAVATIGLICLMILPTPGVLGLIIGTVCALAIVASAVMWLLDRMATRILGWLAAIRGASAQRRPRRDVHAGSGLAKKTSRGDIRVLLQLLSPFAPHICEELWQIQGFEARSGAQQIDAFVPLAEMFGYATDLRSRTQGRGQYTMEPSHYIEIPKNIQDKIINQRTGMRG